MRASSRIDGSDYHAWSISCLLYSQNSMISHKSKFMFPIKQELH